MFSHPRNIDWLARVSELEEEMTTSDAQGVADLEYRSGALPVFTTENPYFVAARKMISVLSKESH